MEFTRTVSPYSFSNVQAIIFDMDGLLLDTERLYMQAYRQAANEAGYDFPDEHYLGMIGHRADSSQTILRATMTKGAPVEEIIDAARRHYYTLIEKDGIPLKAGVMETLDFCDGHGIPMAVATSTHEGLTRAKLESVNLKRRFKAIVCGDQVEHGKPAPDIHLAAAAALKTDPSHCVVLEDSPAGLQAAKSSGAIPIHIPDLLQPTSETQALAWKIYPSLTEFLKDFRTSYMPM